MLVFALVASLGLASGARALGSETALRQNFPSPAERVGDLGPQGRERLQQNLSVSTIVASECCDAARGAANVAAQGKTVLGKFPDYMNLARDLGARRFSIPTNIWNKMTSAEQWAANQKFLDRMIARGDDIILSNPVKSVSDATGWFGRELNYLVEQGFRLSSDGARMIR